MNRTDRVSRASQAPTAGPSQIEFPDWPVGWYVLADSKDVGQRPVAAAPFAKKLVCYRGADGRPVAMDARCWHLGADLSGGKVVGDQVQCPFHGWRFGPSGQCEHVPAGANVPPGAGQRVYPTAERAGKIFVFPAGEPWFPAPFFEGVESSALLAAPPFEFTLNCPWWLVGTNGFDLQHFAGAHDRRLTGPPVVSAPHPAARRIVATFEVCGRSWRDRLTHRWAGRYVTMHVTVWAGTLAFVMASFHDRQAADAVPRSTSYGMTEIRPLEVIFRPRSLVRVTIFTRRRIGLLDHFDVRVRRHFIRAFLDPDARLLDGACYRPDRLIAADQTMADYLHWLTRSSRGRPLAEGSP